MEDLEQPPAPPGHMIHNNLLESGDYIDVGKVASDGLVYFIQQRAAAAWIVAYGTECSILACYLMENINTESSYRVELEGVFWSLKHLEYFNVTPREVRQWCDNERSVINSREAPNRTAGMIKIKADVDLILAIHRLKTNLKFPVDCRHVYGY